MSREKDYNELVVILHRVGVPANLMGKVANVLIDEGWRKGKEVRVTTARAILDEVLDLCVCDEILALCDKYGVSDLYETGGNQ